MIAAVKLRDGALAKSWLRLARRTPEIAKVSVGRAVWFGFECSSGQVVPVVTLT